MNKTIEEAAREYADRPASWKTWGGSRIGLEEAFTAGAAHILSLPLSQRLTDEERERVRTMYNSLYTSGYISACGFRLELESIFGKELFGEGE